VPTHGETFLFLREYDNLSPALQNRFRQALGRFVADLIAIEEGMMTWFRPGLRVKPLQGKADSYEMTWAPDGRAIFRFDEDVIPGKRHVVWESIGTHSILP